MTDSLSRLQTRSFSRTMNSYFHSHLKRRFSQRKSLEIRFCSSSCLACGSCRQCRSDYPSSPLRSAGETILALHAASQKNLAGAGELGFNAPNLDKFHQEMKAKGVQFSMPPTKQDFGGLLAQYLRPSECTASKGLKRPEVSRTRPIGPIRQPSAPKRNYFATGSRLSTLQEQDIVALGVVNYNPCGSARTFRVGMNNSVFANCIHNG